MFLFELLWLQLPPFIYITSTKCIKLAFQEAKAKAEERIRRFGQVVRPEEIITDDVLSRLYARLAPTLVFKVC